MNRRVIEPNEERKPMKSERQTGARRLRRFIARNTRGLRLFGSALEGWTLKRRKRRAPFSSFTLLTLLTLSPLLTTLPAQARINVVTLPGRDSVQLTIYNSV